MNAINCKLSKLINELSEVKPAAILKRIHYPLRNVLSQMFRGASFLTTIITQTRSKDS